MVKAKPGKVETKQARAERLLLTVAGQMTDVLEEVDMTKVKAGLATSLDGKSADAYLEFVACAIKVTKELLGKAEDEGLPGAAGWTGAPPSAARDFDRELMGGNS